MKPLLSIMIPVAPNRVKRLAAVLSRLSLNQAVFPDHTFEVIVLDGGATDNTRELCERMSNNLNLKYIYVPIGRFINAAYPRNVALRVCEGKVIGMIDIDHWPSENIVFGMLNPFVDDKDFRVALIGRETNKVSDVKQYFHNRVIDGTRNNIINRGYVVDSSKSPKCKIGPVEEWGKYIDGQLLNPANFDKQIMDVYKVTGVPPPGVNGTLWIWSVKRENVIPMNGYDELYCRQFAYVREDDDFRERLLAQGLKFFDGQNKNFCAIHLWHPAAWRNQQVNEFNKRYFQQSCRPVRQVRRNNNWQWGKLIKGSFSLINKKMYGIEDHEAWIRENIKDMPNYKDYWTDVNDLINNLGNW